MEKRSFAPPVEIQLTPEQERALSRAWERACDRRPVFGLLRRPNSITAGFSRAIKAAADDGAAAPDDLIEAALRTLPEHGHRP